MHQAHIFSFPYSFFLPCLPLYCYLTSLSPLTSIHQTLLSFLLSVSSSTVLFLFIVLLCSSSFLSSSHPHKLLLPLLIHYPHPLSSISSFPFFFPPASPFPRFPFLFLLFSFALSSFFAQSSPFPKFISIFPFLHFLPPFLEIFVLFFSRPFLSRLPPPTLHIFFLLFFSSPVFFLFFYFFSLHSIPVFPSPCSIFSVTSAFSYGCLQRMQRRICKFKWVCLRSWYRNFSNISVYL